MSKYLFNADFEKMLFSKNPFQKSLNKMNEEFEFFIHLLEPKSTLYSKKNYMAAYKSFLKDFTGHNLKQSINPQNVILWCNDMKHVDECRYLQNKENVCKIVETLNPSKGLRKIISHENQLKDNFLYKFSESLSGAGHFIYPRDEVKIKKILKQGKSLIEEPVLKRVFDFSSLYENKRLLCEYLNEIDSHFQYKGTLIGQSLNLYESQRNLLNKTREAINEHVKNYEGPYSIDSFVYGDNSLYSACEVNMRKTMGYVSYKLKEKYFSKYSYMKLKLIKNDGTLFCYEKLKDIYNEKVFLVSPLDNRFFCFLIVSNETGEIIDLENNLISTLS